MFEQLHAYFAEASQHVRERLGEADISGYRLDIASQGRVHGGAPLITYTISSEYGTEAVSGDRLAAVIDEYLRRKGWNLRHAPRCLPSPYPTTEPVPTPPGADEIPF
jgi:hypothetical protein